MSLQLSDIRKELPFKIQKNIWYGQLHELIRDIKNDRRSLDFDVYLPTKDKNLQRSFCWTQPQKNELIISVIKGTDIQTFSVIMYTPNKSERQSVIKVIDGKQRLSTLIDFCLDKFQIELLGDLYFYSELPESIRTVIDRFDIQFNQVYEYYDDLISDDNKIQWFEQINFAGTPQDVKHLENLKK